MKITQSNMPQPIASTKSTPVEKASATPETASPKASATWQPSHDTRVEGDDVNHQKVEAIKQAIDEGRFSIDVDRIADGLIQDAQATSRDT